MNTLRTAIQTWARVALGFLTDIVVLVVSIILPVVLVLTIKVIEGD